MGAVRRAEDGRDVANAETEDNAVHPQLVPPFVPSTERSTCRRRCEIGAP
jgi:hypothetical protein